MRFITSIAVIAAIAVAPLSSCSWQRGNLASVGAEEQRVLSVEDEYVAAEVGQDEASLRRLVDDRFVLNSSDGKTSGKEELIQTVLKMRIVGQTLRERTILIENDIALIFGTADLQVAGPGREAQSSSLRYTSTYVRRREGWRILALQMQPRLTQ